MTQFINNKQPQHKFYVDAHWDAKEISYTITVYDVSTKKKWAVELAKRNGSGSYNALKGTYDIVKAAIDKGEIHLSFPKEGQPLCLLIFLKQHQVQMVEYKLQEVK
eukprot:487665_1